METVGNIHAQMAAIMADMGVVKKDQKHIQYRYRGIDQALAALKPLLAKHKVYLLPQYELIDIGEGGTTKRGDQLTRATVRVSLSFVSGTDGSSVVVGSVGEGLDATDKAVMKSIANATKYAIYNTFCVPTEEPKDSEAFKDEDVTPVKKPKRATKKAKPDKGILERIDAASSLADLEFIRADIMKLPEDKREGLRDPFSEKQKALA